MAAKKILVYADWIDLAGPKFMGVLNATSTKGREVYMFEYSQEWLDSKLSHIIDPDIQFSAGNQHQKDWKENFGVFLDSSPDRWGKMIMSRRESIYANMEGRVKRTLLPSDYLLGVYDGHRMGALRFKLDVDGDFVSRDKSMATPPWAFIRELENASKKIEEDDLNDTETLKWINMLIAPGSSLGGARPKASIVDTDGYLWIAKFPSTNDNINKGAWEMVVNELAKKAGLNIAEGQAQKFGSRYHTFLTKRFDRIQNGGRIHFASAMTMLGCVDGDSSQKSYLDLVMFLTQNGASPKKDMEELWRRIIFNICVKNTDDHLRNHGFLLTEKGWILSPAYDVNPNEIGAALTLNISEDDNSLDLDLALSVSEYFRLEQDQAKQIIDDVKKAVSGWQKSANQYGIPRQEQERMKSAFEMHLSSHEKLKQVPKEQNELDEKLSQLKKDLDAVDPNERIQKKLNDVTFLEIFDTWLSDLLRKLIPVAQKFNGFFSETRHNIFASNLGGLNFKDEDVEDIISRLRANFQKNKERINNEVKFNFSPFYMDHIHGGLKNISIQYGLKIDFLDKMYKISMDECNEQGTDRITDAVQIPERLLHKPLTEEEIDKLAKKMGEMILNNMNYQLQLNGIK